MARDFTNIEDCADEFREIADMVKAVNHRLDWLANNPTMCARIEAIKWTIDMDSAPFYAIADELDHDHLTGEK